MKINIKFVSVAMTAISGLCCLAAPTMKPAGAWKVEVEDGVARASFEVAPPDVATVTDERYATLPVYDPNSPTWCRGLHLQGVRTYGIAVSGALDEKSLAMKLEDGTPLVRDKDYHLHVDWGCISRLPEGRIGEKTPVLVSYRYAKRRLDAVVASKEGVLSLRPGKSEVCLPKRAPLGKGERYVGTVYLHAGQTGLTDEDLFPVLEAEYQPEPNGDRPCPAAVKCPKTWAKLVAGETVTILAWGDSVTDCGYYADRSVRWQEQFVRRLQAKFPKAKITLLHEGWGGRTVEAFFAQPKGTEHSWEDRVLNRQPKPDLVISEFINDAYLDTDEKVDRVYGRVLKEFREKGYEWIICTPHYARPDWNGLKSMKNCDADPRGFTQALRRFAAKNGIALADAARRWGHLWREGIPYITHLTNDINHPDVESLGFFADALMDLFTCAGTRAIDLSVESQRMAQPKFVQPSFACNVEDGIWADGRWCYRFHVTQSWNGSLPQWPSVNLKPTVTDWTPYDRLVVDVFNNAIGGDVLCAFLSQPDGRLQNGLSPKSLPLADYGYSRWVMDLRKWPKETNPKNIGRVHFFFTTPSSADVHLSGFHLLKPGEPLPPVSGTFLAEKVRPAEARAEALRQERRRVTLERFTSRCRAVGQTGEYAWIGKATSMQKVRPREGFDVEAADAFSLKLARGEYESFQVLVMPNGRDLANVTVEARVEGIDPKAIKTSLVGYVKTINPPPYKGGCNVATNLPGGYYRKTKSLPTGWWPDPILDWTDTTDVKGDDLQGFWVRMKCPDNQRAGTYSGSLKVKGLKGEKAFEVTFPLTVRVYDFAVPKKSPLPLAITFSPEPHLQFATDEDLALAKKLRADPLSPLNAWRKHEVEWGDFLADHYLTMDSLYHGGKGIHWDVLLRLKEQGRLGLFNLGYWSYPGNMEPATLDAWAKNIHARFDAPYAKAKELDILDHAYLYGCDEISPKYFPNIAYALDELKKFYPGVPLFTTAYDHDFGTGESKLAKMDWFTPTTVKYAENFAKVAPSRASGHQVWWYIACGPHAPYANMFVEYTGIEARQLMGAQTVKWRPEGFLYYQISIWNSLRPIEGNNPFTDWEPRSWTRYHGDGSWFCCGPEGRPCATIRMENFRDGLEDLAYAQEYERRTGKTCEVPVEVCRDINQFSEDPKVYYAWRDRIAEEIEKAAKGGSR